MSSLEAEYYLDTHVSTGFYLVGQRSPPLKGQQDLKGSTGLRVEMSVPESSPRPCDRPRVKIIYEEFEQINVLVDLSKNLLVLNGSNEIWIT